MFTTVGRSAESRILAGFLDPGRTDASALFIEGDAGIGKTTLWLDGLRLARERGFTVLAAQPAPAESALAHGVLTDLLDQALPASGKAWASLRTSQRQALERIVHADEPDRGEDARAVAAGFLALIRALAVEAPVLIAVDDVQWSDPSSREALAFAARRVAGPVSLLVTERTTPEAAPARTWLRLLQPEATRTLEVGPLSLGGLHAVLRQRLRRSFPRPAMARIAEASGGNPFYALELGRAMLGGAAGDAAGDSVPLPGTLIELVAARLDALAPQTHPPLLAVACLGAPTLSTVARAAETDPGGVARLLEPAEDRGIVAIEGNRVRFCDPLMSRGVYLRASPATRRSMHRRLSSIVAEPELKARHLAWAATEGDPQTLAALDEAARSAQARGAPTTAAELLDIAIHLGGDTPQRRIRSAGHHLAAGDAATARQLLETTANGLPPGELRSKAVAQLAAVCVVDDNLLEAAALLERALGEAGDPAQRTRISIALAFTLANAGHPGAAVDRIDEATAEAERLGHPPLLCQALTLGVHLRFLRGEGVDESALDRAMTLEGRSRVPAVFRPSVHRALLSAWTGRLREARGELLAVRRECMDHGEETELIPVTFNSFLVELWLGHVDDARAVADDAMERAAALGGDLARGLALTMRAALAALTGDAEQARADTGAALEAASRCSASTMAMWPTSIRGFLELSLQEHRTALATLEPMLAALEPSAPTEIITAVFVPDAVEAMIETGALDRAEALIGRLERTGTRLGRPWALAVGARCRSLLFAANGDLESATRSAHEALRAHARLEMPFERARTELVLGRLQRRRRQRDAAAASLRRCLAVFDELGATVWADRTRAELARLDVTPGAGTGLTSSEKRVAELAAEGRTNRDIATALFISPKTVEANLARAYRKLGIRCRAQLAGRLHCPEKVVAR